MIKRFYNFPFLIPRKTSILLWFEPLVILLTLLTMMISFSVQKSVILSVSFILCFWAISTTALRKAETSPYVSVRALDNFGNAVQLSHAKEAANRYGRSIVVAVVDVYDQKNCTMKIPKNQQLSKSFLMVVSMGTSPILHPIQLPVREHEKDSPPFLAMCFTGVKGDAIWLLRQVQKYVTDVWERYDESTMSAPDIAYVVARLVGRFAAHPEKQEWQSSLGLPGKRDRDDSRQSSWSRPLGVQTMIASLNSCLPSRSFSHDGQQRVRHPGLLIVEPSGIILNTPARSKSDQVFLGAMGKGCEKIQERLLRLFQRNSLNGMSAGDSSVAAERLDDASSSWEDIPPTYEECRDTLIRILLEETVSDNDAGGNIMVESFCLDKGEIERNQFRYKNANNYVPL